MNKILELIGENEYKSLEIKKFEAQSYITDSKKSSNFYFILKGRALIIHNTLDKDIFYPFYFKEGHLLGELFNDNPYVDSWDIIANTEVELVIIPLEKIEKWKETNIAFLNYLHEHTKEVATTSYMFYYIQREKGLEGSFAYILVNFSDGDSLYFKSMSRLAELLGVSRRAFYYVFSQFVEKGLVEKVSNRQIRVLDRFALMDIYERGFLELD